MSIQMRTERNTEGSSLYVAFPEMRCDICQRKINTMNPGKVMGVLHKAAPVYHVHEGKCLNEFLDASAEANWVGDDVHDHFFRLLAILGFIIENDQIVIDRPM